MQRLYKRMAGTYDITAIFVTHNVKEAIIMGDRIAKLADGRLTVYDSPEAFVASGDHTVREEIEFWESVRSDNSNKSQPDDNHT